MNDWKTIRKVAIVESDDTYDMWSRNGMNFLFYWKSLYPKFKITLYTIPAKTSINFLKLLKPFIKDGWIELAVHGFSHESNFECYEWDYEIANSLLTSIERRYNDPEIGYFYTKNFKAPGWTITPDLCGYPATDPSLPINKDKQAVYKALGELGYVICDRHYNKPRRITEDNVICIDCNPQIIHMHTWKMTTGDINGQNGYQQVEELHGVPWDQDTEFYTMREAWEKQLYLPCK